MTFKHFQGDQGVRKKERRVNGGEQLTEDCVCRQCRVLSLTDCELLSDDVLWACEFNSSS